MGEFAGGTSMREWCLDHPYLTFFIILSVLSTCGNIVLKIIELFVRPPPPTTVNMNMKIDPPPSIPVDDYEDIIN